MNVLDLFSGIGGLSLGLERAGMKTIAFCEIDKFCQNVLKKHWPNVPIFDDITKLERTMINEPVDLVCGGFPCQPFSFAGKRKGKEDNRHLWPEMLRIISEFEPSWVIGENVAGIIDMELEQVCLDLETEGYEVQPFVIPACAVNAPHRRDRVWIIANVTNSTSERLQRSIETNGEQGAESNDKQPIGFYREWDENWVEVATQFCGISHGIPNRIHRLKCLGNSVVPQIVEIIGASIVRIAEYDNQDSR